MNIINNKIKECREDDTNKGLVSGVFAFILAIIAFWLSALAVPESLNIINYHYNSHYIRVTVFILIIIASSLALCNVFLNKMRSLNLATLSITLMTTLM